MSATKNNQPTYKRQRFLLAFIRQLQSGITSTDLQKLIFLHTMKEGSDFYEFVPYKFGSYSFQLAEDIGILCRNNYVSNEGASIRAIGDYKSEDRFSISTERGYDLIRKAYREYPYYAINSKIVDRLFKDEEAQKYKNEMLRYAQTSQVLFTIGYEGMGIEAFINTLIRNDIRLLCDVRKNPLSRKFGFSKKILEHITETVGIKYVHIPDLGIESDQRCALNTTEDYKQLFDGYAKTLLNLEPQLNDLYSLLRSNGRIALMCFEKASNMCHRHVIRDYLLNVYPIWSLDL
jgi:uncharacterized protein YwgA